MSGEASWEIGVDVGPRRSPWPSPKQIGDQMRDDRDASLEPLFFQSDVPDWMFDTLWAPARLNWIATPAGTDNAQCWTEEIFSLL